MDINRITPYLPSSVSLLTYDLTDSTNLRVKEYARSGGELPVLIVASGQTAGRGRLGRSFYSPEGTGVYFSLGFIAEAPESVAALTGAAAVAVSRAIAAATGLDPKIKWVNDIYLNGGKVCGILAESVPRPEGLLVIVGIGVNLTTEVFPEGFSNPAASLGVDGIAEELVGRTVAELDGLMQLGTAAFIDEYRARSFVPGHFVTLLSPGADPVSAHALAISDDCGLIVRLEDGTETTLRTGEVSVKIRN